MQLEIEAGWAELLKDEFKKPYFAELMEFVDCEYENAPVFPPAGQIFRAFDECKLEDLKVVILGQDPYHGHGQANGLCFSVAEGLRYPPSLRNIFKEIEADMGSAPESSDLGKWAQQGVLMLNATLTVRKSEAGSHQGKGWEQFTDRVIEIISEKCENVVFLLWGKFAQSKEELIDSSRHLILKAAHPSPFSAHRGFFGCGHFSKANQYLAAVGKEGVDWS